jgi:hypothetical protein
VGDCGVEQRRVSAADGYGTKYRILTELVAKTAHRIAMRFLSSIFSMPRQRMAHLPFCSTGTLSTFEQS